MANKKDDKIVNWEIVDPIELIKTIDETMKIIEKQLKDKPENELLQHIYSLYFLIRSNTMINMALLKHFDKDEITKTMEEDTDYFM